MASFKIIIRKDKVKKDGTIKVQIQLVHNASNTTIPNGWFVTEKDLHKDGTIKNAQLRLAIEKYVIELSDWCNNHALEIRSKTAKEVALMLLKKDEVQEFHLDFVLFVHDCANELFKEDRGGTAKLRLSAINSFVRFLGRKEIDINEITTRLLSNWLQWITEQPAPKGKRGTRAPQLYYNQLRVCYNQAKDKYNDEDLGIITIPRDPFAKAIVPKEMPAQKRALSVEQMRAIINLQYERETPNKVNRYNLAKDIFILSFCLIGMNAADLFYCDNRKKDKLIYERQKTHTRRDDNARMEVTIPDIVKPIAKKYFGGSVGRVFRFSKMYSSVGNFSCALNIGLKKIGSQIGVPDLQFYAARHTWATIAVNDCRIDKWTVHQALNHVGDKTAITDCYIKKDWKITDDANKKVLDYVFGILNPEHPKETL